MQQVQQVQQNLTRGYPDEASLVFGGMIKIPESESEVKN
jgi:hypothetical protein